MARTGKGKKRLATSIEYLDGLLHRNLGDNRAVVMAVKSDPRIMARGESRFAGLRSDYVGAALARREDGSLCFAAAKFNRGAENIIAFSHSVPEERGTGAFVSENMAELLVRRGRIYPVRRALMHDVDAAAGGWAGPGGT